MGLTPAKRMEAGAAQRSLKTKIATPKASSSKAVMKRTATKTAAKDKAPRAVIPDASTVFAKKNESGLPVLVIEAWCVAVASRLCR